MTLPSNTPSPSTTPRLSILEKRDLLIAAWSTLAPDTQFANMTLAEFIASASPSSAHRATLASLKANVDAGIAERNLADNATRLLIKRVVGSIIADAAFGPDSPLYRAMGYVRASERRRPCPADPAAAAPAPSQSPAELLVMDRLDKILSAWTEIAPDALFAGMTLSQFMAGAAPSSLARSALESARTKLKAGIATRDDADAVTHDLIKRVVSGVKSDANFGDDCPLYRAMGYRRASERRSAKRAAPGDCASTSTSASTLQPPQPDRNETSPHAQAALPDLQAKDLPVEPLFESRSKFLTGAPPKANNLDPAGDFRHVVEDAIGTQSELT